MGFLIPGGMGPTGGSAKPGEFVGSMAEAMENALNDLLSNDGINRFEVNTNSEEARARRRIFVAIAQGVLSHLQHNADSLWIENTLNVQLPVHIELQTDPKTL
jgi:hypothetical protein